MTDFKIYFIFKYEGENSMKKHKQKKYLYERNFSEISIFIVNIDRSIQICANAEQMKNLNALSICLNFFFFMSIETFEKATAYTIKHFKILKYFRKLKYTIFTSI